jgi:hypothetical protein
VVLHNGVMLTPYRPSVRLRAAGHGGMSAEDLQDVSVIVVESTDPAHQLPPKPAKVSGRTAALNTRLPEHMR